MKKSFTDIKKKPIYSHQYVGVFSTCEVKDSENKGNIIERIILLEHDGLCFDNDDIIIMCSDGLSNYISDEGILEFVRQYKANNLTNALVEEAKQQGGRDNITVAVIYANNIREW